MTFKQHWNYFKGLMKHKRGVLLGCKIMKVPLWRAILHDWTKFLPREWFAYVRQFRNPDGTRREVRNKDGSYNPAEQSYLFQQAWIYHQRNRHHWQAWCSIGDKGEITPIPIPQIYLKEIIADWIGAGLAYSDRLNPVSWYEDNKYKMVFCSETRERLEQLLYDVFGKPEKIKVRNKEEIIKDYLTIQRVKRERNKKKG